MHALSFQISAISVGLFLLGLGAGWWLAQLFHQYTRTACYQDLVRLRYAHQRLQQDVRELNQQLAHCEAEKNHAFAQLHNSADLYKFEQLHQQLMHARNQLQNTIHSLNKREQQLRYLSDLVKLLRQQERTLNHSATQANLPNKTSTLVHRLNSIEGIDAASVQKLHMLGILNCEQLATCNSAQLKLIQGLISQERILPLAKWVRSARLLAQARPSSNCLAN